MTLYTSDTNGNQRYLKTAFVYLIISICVAGFGAVYEIFSHGVYSFCMIYAFAFPLLGGALPFLLAYCRKALARPAKQHDLHLLPCSTQVHAAEEQTIADRGFALNLYHAAIATFTIGSIMQGVLYIYGTTNRLTLIYPAAGVVLLSAAVMMIIVNGRKTEGSAA